MPRVMQPGTAASEPSVQGAGRYGIEKVMRGDGSTIPGTSRVLERGTFYASNSQQNSAVDFFVVDMDTYSAPGGRNMEFIVHAETTPAKKLEIFWRGRFRESTSPIFVVQ